MMNDFTKAIGDYFQAFRLISRLNLWAYMIIPAIISFLLAGLIFFLSYSLSDNIGALLSEWYPWEWGSSIIEKIGSIAGGFFIAVFGFLIYKNLVIVAVGPFMSPLSEKVERALSGVDVSAKFSVSRMVVDASRGLRLAIRNLIRELFYTFLLFLLGLIPIFAPFTTALIFLVQSFYAGFGNFDFLLERHYKIRGRVQFVRSHKGLATGNGLVFMLLLFTGVGVLVAPTLSTIAATISGVEQLKAEGELKEELL